jgi:hypothetical protein
VSDQKFIFSYVASDWQPTMDLRILRVDGQQDRLQRAWWRMSAGKTRAEQKQEIEWRDVPIVRDADQPKGDL